MHDQLRREVRRSGRGGEEKLGQKQHNTTSPSRNTKVVHHILLYSTAPKQDTPMSPSPRLKILHPSLKNLVIDITYYNTKNLNNKSLFKFLVLECVTFSFRFIFV